MKVVALTWVFLVGSLVFSQGATNPLPPKDAPRIIDGSMRREGDPKFSSKEQKIISASHQYADRGGKSISDAYFKITATPKDFEVFIMFVGGYHGNQPVFYPGGFCIVHVDKNGKAFRLDPGD